MKNICLLFLTALLIITSAFAQWEQCKNIPDQPLHEVFEALTLRTINDIIYLGSTEGLIISGNSGTDWKRIGLDSMLDVRYITVEGNKIFVKCDGSGVFFSTDNGSNWDPIKDHSVDWELGPDAILLRNSKCYLGTQHNGVYTSTDNGLSWAASNNGLPSGIDVRNITNDGDNIFIATNHGLFMSSDNGKSWQPKNNGIESRAMYCMIFKDNNIFASSDKGLYMSTDYGTNWQLNNGLTDTDIKDMIFRDNNIIAVSYWGKIVISTDFGDSWQDKSMNNGIYINSLTSQGDYIFVAAEGIVYKARLSDLISPSSVNQQSEQSDAFSITPNPASNKIAIRMENNGLNQNLNIYDIFGQQLYSTYFNETVLTIDVSAFPSGAYVAAIGKERKIFIVSR